MGSRVYRVRRSMVDAVTRLTIDLMHAWCVTAEADDDEWAQRHFDAAVRSAFKRHNLTPEQYEEAIRQRITFAQSGIAAAILLMHKQVQPEGDLTEAEAMAMGGRLFGPTFALAHDRKNDQRQIGTVSASYGFVPVASGSTWREAFARYIADRAAKERRATDLGTDGRG